MALHERQWSFCLSFLCHVLPIPTVVLAPLVWSQGFDALREAQDILWPCLLVIAMLGVGHLIALLAYPPAARMSPSTIYCISLSTSFDAPIVFIVATLFAGSLMPSRGIAISDSWFLWLVLSAPIISAIFSLAILFISNAMHPVGTPPPPPETPTNTT